jgi:hypothetical protein
MDTGQIGQEVGIPESYREASASLFYAAEHGYTGFRLDVIDTNPKTKSFTSEWVFKW